MSRKKIKVPVQKRAVLSEKAVERIVKGALAAFYQEVLLPQFKQIDQRFERNEEKVNEIYNHIDGLYKRFETLEIEYHAITAALRRIEERLDRLEVNSKDTGKLKADLEALKQNAGILQDRIAAVEQRLSQI